MCGISSPRWGFASKGRRGPGAARASLAPPLAILGCPVGARDGTDETPLVSIQSSHGGCGDGGRGNRRRRLPPVAVLQSWPSARSGNGEQILSGVAGGTGGLDLRFDLSAGILVGPRTFCRQHVAQQRAQSRYGFRVSRRAQFVDAEMGRHRQRTQQHLDGAHEQRIGVNHETPPVSIQSSRGDGGDGDRGGGDWGLCALAVLFGGASVGPCAWGQDLRYKGFRKSIRCKMLRK